MFGTIFAFLTKDDKDFVSKIMPYLFIIIGLAGIIIPLLQIFKIIIDVTTIVITFILCIFLLVGLSLIIDIIVKRKKLKSDKYISTYGKIIGLNESINDGTKVYAPIIEYIFNGKKHTYESDNYSNSEIPSIGDIINIKTDPNCPNKIIFKESGEWIQLIIGFSFVLIILIIFILLIILPN